MADTYQPGGASGSVSIRDGVILPTYRNLADLLGATAATYGAAPAFTCCLPNGMNGTLSFAQVDEMSDALAIYLRDDLGLKRGDRVAVQIPNSLSFPVAAFGVLKAGCILVPVNPLYTAREMAQQFEDAEPGAVIIADIFADKLPAATKRHQISHVIVARVAEFLPGLPRAIVGLVQRYWEGSVKPIDAAHIRLPEAIARSRTHQTAVDAGRFHREIDADDTAVLQYTSGTTGTPKGAMLTHGNLLANLAQVIERTEDIEAGSEVALTVLPLYHIFAFTVNLLGFYSLGARNILIPNPRPLSNLKRAFETYKITWMSGVNTLFNGLSNELWFCDTPPRYLKFASAGGMALQSTVATRWQEITGSPMMQGYGLTETSPVLTFTPLGQNRDGSVGMPVAETEIACLRDDGMPVAHGESGEIAVKGPQVMKGYWRKPDDTARVMREGWFLTGDIGVMNDDGYLRIVDRKKDVIIVSGFNVYPTEIEEILIAHPGVSEAAVVGVPDSATGEAVRAFIVATEGALTADVLRAHCTREMVAYKVPKQIVFRDALPKSPVGKILRKELRAEDMTRNGGVSGYG